MVLQHVPVRGVPKDASQGKSPLVSSCKANAAQQSYAQELLVRQSLRKFIAAVSSLQQEPSSAQATCMMKYRANMAPGTL